MVTTDDVSTTRPHQRASEHVFERCDIGAGGLVLTEVCLGTMTWGKQNNEQEAHAQLDYAHARGVAGIDAAELYPVPPEEGTCGETERIIGKWIEKRGGNAFRDSIVLASKVAGGSGGSRALPWIRGESRTVNRDNIRAAVHDSLRRLRTDYIDLYQIHWPDRYVPLFGAGAYDEALERDAVSFEEQVRAMDELIREGKIRHYGLSNETAWGVAQFDAMARATGCARPASVQNSYSLIYRDFESHLAEACSTKNANTPLLAYSPLAGGVLTGKYLREEVEEGVRFSMYPNYMKRFQSSLAAKAIVEYEKVAKEVGLSLTELSLAWCKSRKFIGSTIIGATSTEQLKENLDAFSITLDESVIAEVNRVYNVYRDPSRTS